MEIPLYIYIIVVAGTVLLGFIGCCIACCIRCCCRKITKGTEDRNEDEELPQVAEPVDDKHAPIETEQ